MLDVARGIRPPDQCDDSANEPQKEQKSQWIEAIGLAIPTLSPASHTNLPFSQRPVLKRDPLEMRVRPSPGKAYRHA